jgi:methylated-DNA-[protein]-cysteine S-methyltransferase
MSASVRFPTALGDCHLAWSEAGVTSFSLPAAPVPRADTAAWKPPVSLPQEIASLIDRVRRHLRGDLQDFRDVRFAWTSVTPFRRKVLQALLGIGPGRTSTYGALARTIGAKPGASRAVGGAVGANPWPLLVPCHRILGADGKLTGYSALGGLKTKALLLALEGAEMPAR